MNNVNQVSSPSLDQDLAEAGLNQEPQTAESFNRPKTGQVMIPVPFPFPPPTVATEVERELKEAELAEGDRKSVDGVIVTREAIRRTEKELEAAIGVVEQLSEATKTVEELSKNAEFVEQLEKAGVEIDHDAVTNMQSEIERLVKSVGWRNDHSIFEPRDPDLRAFKKQVVAAFKHLGLDTKQFFGV